MRVCKYWKEEKRAPTTSQEVHVLWHAWKHTKAHPLHQLLEGSDYFWGVKMPTFYTSHAVAAAPVVAAAAAALSDKERLLLFFRVF